MEGGISSSHGPGYFSWDCLRSNIIPDTPLWRHRPLASHKFRCSILEDLGLNILPPVNWAGFSIREPFFLHWPQPPLRKMCHNTFQRGSVARWNVGQNNPENNKCEVPVGREWIAICHHRYHPHPHNHPQPSALHQPKRPFRKGSALLDFPSALPDFPSAPPMPQRTRIKKLGELLQH